MSFCSWKPESCIYWVEFLLLEFYLKMLSSPSMGGKYTETKLKRFLGGNMVLQKFKLKKHREPVSSHLSCKGFFLALQWNCSFTYGREATSEVLCMPQLREIKLPLSALCLSSWRNVLSSATSRAPASGWHSAQKQLQPSPAQGPSICHLTKSLSREGSLAYSVEYLVLIVFVSRCFSNYSKTQKPWVVYSGGYCKMNLFEIIKLSIST